MSSDEATFTVPTAQRILRSVDREERRPTPTLCDQHVHVVGYGRRPQILLGKTTEAIGAGSSGSVEIYRDGAASGEYVEAYNDWSPSPSPLASGDSVQVVWVRDREKWVISSAEDVRVKVNAADTTAYLSEQFVDLKDPSDYAVGDLVSQVGIVDQAGDKILKLYVDATNYDSSKKQALTHDVSTDQAEWHDVVTEKVIMDLRLYNGILQKRVVEIEVLSKVDKGWVTALPTTEC